MELLLGILCGIALSLFFSFGPAFFSLIQTSIQYGYRRALFFPLGVFASDAVVVFLILTVLKDADMFQVMHNPYVASIGGAVMIAMGILTFRKTVRPVVHKEPQIKFRTNKSKPKTIFFNGFLINFLNPLIWVYWLSVIALISGEMNIKTTQMYIFFAGLLGTTLGLDILKCKAASLLQRVITAKVLNIFNKITGCIFFIFAGYLIISMLTFQLNPAARERQLENEQNQQSVKIIKNINQGLHNNPLLKDTNSQPAPER
ncbi:MAG: LysE family transporter [Bacteroidales bacterium]|nr:LysE family transporter [Bacteroidales bacterium]